MAPDNFSNWRPTASLANLQLRAQITARVRAYFARHGVLEVDTPVLSQAGTTDPHLHSFMAHSLAPGDSRSSFYLHTSPEFAMKRLLAAGSGSIYQICKVFRAGEAGRRHNPEFTMLEWYRVNYDHHRLMDDVEALVRETLADMVSLQPSERLTYADAFHRYTGIDPHHASATDLRDCAHRHGITVSGLAADDKDGWLNLLLTHLVEPHLGRGRLTFIHDYPASQAALACIRREQVPVAERFELYLEGIELANGFHELANAEEQRARFETERRNRQALGLSDIPHDQYLLAALQHGLPECSGVALGLDRLVMLAAGAASIVDVIPFPADRA